MNSKHDSIVFKPGRIGQTEIKNRLVRSATYENAATPQGEVTDKLIDIYGTLAKGGVGLIITGCAAVHANCASYPLIMRLDSDALIPGLAKISRAVHQSASDCKVMLQLFHPGRQVLDPSKRAQMGAVAPPAMLAYIQKHPEVLSQQVRHPVIEPTAPSAVYDTLFERTPRALTEEEIEKIIDAYASSARRAAEAGFDGVQVHAAHGYLLSTFLSPRTNRREDRYGGSTENRTRIVREIYGRIRQQVGDEFPILIKINTTDFLPDGTDLREAARVGEILSAIGFAAIETSGGMWEAVTQPKEALGWPPVLLPESRTGIKSKEQEAYFLPGAKAIGASTNATIMLVGGLRSFSRIEEVLQAGAADFVSLSRPLIRQPDLPELWKSGKGADKAQCISCNACLPIGALPLACRAKAK
ncbi:MAG: NADH:flavin oxidoreductase [Desulfosarcinaceae bacterium]|jgi:2,4-dienoyl-CoA reductase-like NADH-dependent reductase (Old Yellow Enzyme family)